MEAQRQRVRAVILEVLQAKQEWDPREFRNAVRARKDLSYDDCERAWLVAMSMDECGDSLVLDIDDGVVRAL